MEGPKCLLDSEDHWVTSMGGWFPGKRVVFRGFVSRPFRIGLDVFASLWNHREEVQRPASTATGEPLDLVHQLS